MRERKFYEENQGSYLSENKLFIIFAGATFLLFIALALFSYNSFIKGQNSSEVVLIKADEQPYKITPEDPGGMKVNYQDKEVFNTLIGKDEGAPSQAINNIDEPAQPMSPEEVMRKAEGGVPANENLQAINTASGTAPIASSAKPATVNNTSSPAIAAGEENTNAANSIKNPSQAPVMESTNNTEGLNNNDPASPSNLATNGGVIKIGESRTADMPAEIPSETIVEAQKPKSVTNKESGSTETLDASKANAKTDTAAAQKGGKFFVQLGAFSSTQALDKMWNTLKSKHSSAITGSKMVNKLQRDGKTLYSLGFGPYKQKIAATEACNKLKAKGQDCIVKAL